VYNKVFVKLFGWDIVSDEMVGLAKKWVWIGYIKFFESLKPFFFESIGPWNQKAKVVTQYTCKVNKDWFALFSSEFKDEQDERKRITHLFLY